MSGLDDTRHCPMCEDAAKTIADQKRTIKVLNSCIGGEGSLTTDNITRVEELEQRVKVLTDGLEKLLIGEDFSLGYNEGNHIAELLNQTPQQTAAQIERWHIEWMMKLPVEAYKTNRGAVYGGEHGGADSKLLVAIPPLPKESNSPETDLDEALRRQ